MITNKDISIDKDGNIILNGDKYPLASQAEIDAVKDDIDNLGDTIGDITQTGYTGSTVADQLTNIKSREGMRVLSTSAHPTDVSFTNGVGTINLLDIDSKAMEIVALFCWGQNVTLSFSLSNWATKVFTINNLTNPTYSGTLPIEVIYSVYYEV